MKDRKQKTETESSYRLLSTADSARFTAPRAVPGQRGFTLIETFVAISILTIAIVAPMALAARSLGISYYVRDEVTAYYLAQEAIEMVRNVRDANILANLLTGSDNDLLTGVPNTTGAPFTVDAHVATANSMQLCSGTCPPIQYNGTFYGYNDGVGSWVPTRFTRSVRAVYVDAGRTNLRLQVTVSWRTSGFSQRSVTITEELYEWAVVSEQS